MRTACILALAASLVGVASAPAFAQPKPVSPLPAEIVAAWEQAGAQTGWMGSGEFGFRPGGEGKEGEVPAFRFRELPLGVLSKLPQPERGFGLDLSNANVTDAGLKELAGLPSLQWINLLRTHVNADEGELKRVLPGVRIQRLNKAEGYHRDEDWKGRDGKY